MAFQSQPIGADGQTPPARQDPINFLPPAATPSATPMIDGLIKRSEQIQKLTVREIDTPEKAVEDSPKKDSKLLRVGTDSRDLNFPNQAVRFAAKSSKSSKSATSEDRLKIVGPRLCRKVVKFGTLDPLPKESLAPGQRAVLYLELAGVRYDHREDKYLSKHATRIELFRAAGRGSKIGTEPVWVEMPEDADYTCDHPLRDFYLNYVITLPKTLSPGDYLLKLSVTDLVSTRSATSEIPLTIEQ